MWLIISNAATNSHSRAAPLESERENELQGYSQEKREEGLQML